MLSAQRGTVNHSTSNEKSAAKIMLDCLVPEPRTAKYELMRAPTLSLHRDIKVEAVEKPTNLSLVKDVDRAREAKGCRMQLADDGMRGGISLPVPLRPPRRDSNTDTRAEQRASIESERGRGSSRFDSCSPLLPPLLLLPPRLRFLENTHNRRVNCEDSGRILVWRGEREGKRHWLLPVNGPGRVLSTEWEVCVCSKGNRTWAVSPLFEMTGSSTITTDHFSATFRDS